MKPVAIKNETRKGDAESHDVKRTESTVATWETALKHERKTKENLSTGKTMRQAHNKKIERKYLKK